MDSKCGFCLAKLKKNEGINVKELVIDTHPRIVKFTDVLFDLFYCEIDVSKICSECMDSVNKQYLFKEKLKKVLKMPKHCHVDIIRKVQNFLSKSDENISVVSHLDILHIVPSSRNTLMQTIQKFHPEVQLTRNDKITHKSTAISIKAESSFNNSIAKTPKISNVSFISSHRTVSFYDGNDDDDNDTIATAEDDEDYGKQKKSKRKKKSSPKRKSSKKQKTSNESQFVKEEHQSCENLVKFEHTDYANHIESGKRSINNNVLHSTGLMRRLNSKQREWLNEKIKTTKRNGNTYICTICSKFIVSFFGITYHYIHRHFFKNLPNSKIWVAQKVQEGSKMIKDENGNQKMIFQCTECSKIYKNQPGLRYHLTQYIVNDANDDEFCAVDEN